jgi:hypothetical protein
MTRDKVPDARRNIGQSGKTQIKLEVVHFPIWLKHCYFTSALCSSTPSPEPEELERNTCAGADGALELQ